MRKHVMPADPQATIPDPERRTDLPAEGREVAWSVHWARLQASGDIVVSDVAEADVPAEAPEPSPAEPEVAPPAAEEAPKVQAKASAAKVKPAA